MRVMVGESRSHYIVGRLKELGWARLWTQNTPTPFPGEKWGLDSGIYADWSAGRTFDDNRFLRRVDKALTVTEPIYMAVTPDIVGGGVESLEWSLSWLDRLPSEFPWFLAVQDGMTIEDVEPVIAGRFSGIFVGGTNRFKGTACEWVRLAKKHGLPTHYGRAGTPQKLQNAIDSKADTCDSSFPLWTKERFNYFAECWRNNPQPRLDLIPHRRSID